MRHPAPTPTGSALPLPRARSGRSSALVGSVELARDSVERFNALVHELCLDAPQVDADAIASVAAWLDAQPAEQGESLLQSRLDRLADLEAMLADADWTMEAAQSHRIARILAYVAEDNDLIPNTIPIYGHLDDALLLELAWPMLAEDVDDYHDFCHFRDEAAGHTHRRVQQIDWLNARAEEGALWEHQHRVHGQAYVEYGAPAAFFRVS